MTRVLEVYRDPVDAGSVRECRSVRTFGPDDLVSPLAAPDRSMSVAQLLP